MTDFKLTYIETKIQVPLVDLNGDGVNLRVLLLTNMASCWLFVLCLLPAILSVSKHFTLFGPSSQIAKFSSPVLRCFRRLVKNKNMMEIALELWVFWFNSPRSSTDLTSRRLSLLLIKNYLSDKNLCYKTG